MLISTLKNEYQEQGKEYFMTEKIIDRTINPMEKYPYPPLTAEQLNAIRPYKELKYNSEIVDEIVKTCEMFGDIVTEEEKSNLGSYVYLARQQFREEGEQARLTELAKTGYEPLTHEVAKGLNGKKVEVLGTYELDWYSEKVKQIYKILVNDDRVFLMKPRARSRGLSLHRLENPVYKLVN